MMQLISEAVKAESPPTPTYKPAYDFAPPVDLTDLQLFTKGQPWEAFRQMRERAPVCWHNSSPKWENDPGGFWNITRHKDVQAVSKDTETFSSQRGGMHMALAKPMAEVALPLYKASFNNMICMDGEPHSTLRQAHNPFFTTEQVAQLQARVEGKVNELLDDIAPLGACDLVEHLSAQLPLFTLSEILGIPESDRHLLVNWMHYLELGSYISTAGPDSVDTEVTPELVQGFLDTCQDLFEYGRRQLHDRRKKGTEDLLNTIAWSKLEESLLADEYLDGSWLLIVFAGNDTTRNTISGTMKLLTENPDQKQKLLANMDLLPGMVEEAIRMVSPVMHMRRTATRDTELGGQKIAEGEKLVMWYGAANRDPEMFPEPDQFDIERANANRQIAFGFGKHMCIGHRVARMQLQTVYRQILKRFPDMEYAGGIDIAPNNFVHAIRKLPVRFTPES